MKIVLYAALGAALLLVSSALSPVQAQTAPAYIAAPVPVKTRYLPGDTLPEQFRKDTFVMADAAAHNLETPPAGYRWLRHDANRQYLMVSTATGAIADAVDQAGASRFTYDSLKPATSGASDARSTFARGGRAPARYRTVNYLVSDWRSRNLQAPKQGYGWIHDGDGHYALVNHRTGRIIEIAD